MTSEHLNLDRYRRIVFFTGAGMSAESGVPYLSGQGGIWKEYDYEEYAYQDAFDRDPAAVWEFHNYRRSLVASCKPNAGHTLIAELEHQGRDVTVVTQNIDGLHQRAGSERSSSSMAASGGFAMNLPDRRSPNLTCPSTLWIDYARCGARTSCGSETVSRKM